MADVKKAKSLGRKKAYETVLIGVSIFYVIGVFIFSNEGLQSLLWLSYIDLYNWMFILNWVISFLIVAYFVGSHAGKQILVKKNHFVKTGIVSGILMVIFGAVLGCFLGFLLESAQDLETKQPIIDFFLVPIFWIILYGIAPSILLGVWFGYRLKSLDFKL